MMIHRKEFAEHAYKFVSSLMTATLLAHGNRRCDDAEELYTEFIQTVNLEYELTERIGAFTEWFCFVPSGATVAQTQHYLHGGFVYLPSDNIQLDIHAGFGANQAAADFFGGVGFSIRFP